MINFIMVQFLKCSFSHFGRNCKLFPLCSTFVNPHLISIYNNTYIGPRCTFSIYNALIINDNCLFGPEVMILSGNHKYSIPGKFICDSEEDNKGPIIFEKDVWVGARAIILGGVTIGEGSIIGANSVVTKNIRPYTIAAGSPCKELKPRFPMDDLRLHLKLVNSYYSIDDLKFIYEK